MRLVDKPADPRRQGDGRPGASLEVGAHVRDEAGIGGPALHCVVDKQFASRPRPARDMVGLSGQKRVGIFSAASLSYDPALGTALATKSTGKFLGEVRLRPGVDVDSDKLNPRPSSKRDPRLEILYTLMGPGC